jgi:hypothetical protein
MLVHDASFVNVQKTIVTPNNLCNGMTSCWRVQHGE